MLAEAFRAPGERMPIGGARPHRPGRRRRRLGAALGPQPHELRRRRAPTTSRCSSTSILLHRRHPDDAAVSGPTSSARSARRRVLRADAVLDRRHDADGDATDLLVIFLALEMLSLAVYVLTGIRRDQPAGDRRRRSSTSCSARSRARSSSTASRFTYAVTGTHPARPARQR